MGPFARGEQGGLRGGLRCTRAADDPARPYGEPGEIGSVVAFLGSERASYVTGVSLQVDGGGIQSTF